MERAFAVKYQGDLLVETVSPSKLYILDHFRDLLEEGGEIVEVVVEESGEIKPHKSTPNTYIFSSGKGYMMGGINPSGKMVGASSVIHPTHPLIPILSRIGPFASDSLFLADICSVGPTSEMVRSAWKLTLFDNGDSTTASKLFRDGKLQDYLSRFMEEWERVSSK
jgi:hypothetical protein